MSQQESVFFDNEQESVYEPRQNNAAAVTNQQAKQDGTYGFLTPERSMLQGEKLLSKSRSFQRSNNSWKWKVVLAIICFLLIAIGLTISAIPQQFTGPGSMPMPMPIQDGPASHQQVFDVGFHPKIVLYNINSNVQITVGDNNTVTVSGVNPKHKNYRSRDWSGDIQAKSNNNEIIITGPPTREGFRDDSEQSVDIRVPEQADIEVHNITGDINITGVGGLIQARTQKGDITLHRVVLNSASLLQTLNGNIRFNGSLDQLGTYIMTTANGSLDISLPPDASFRLLLENSALDIDNAFQQNTIDTALLQPILDISATEKITIKQY